MYDICGQKTFDSSIESVWLFKSSFVLLYPLSHLSSFSLHLERENRANLFPLIIFFQKSTKNVLDLDKYCSSSDRIPLPPPTIHKPQQKQEEIIKTPSRPDRAPNHRPLPPPRQEPPPRSPPSGPKTRPDHVPAVRLRPHRRRLIPRRSRALPQNPRPQFRHPAPPRGGPLPQLRAEEHRLRQIRALLAQHAQALHTGALKQPQDRPVPAHETGRARALGGLSQTGRGSP